VTSLLALGLGVDGEGEEDEGVVGMARTYTRFCQPSRGGYGHIHDSRYEVPGLNLIAAYREWEAFIIGGYAPMPIAS
jgi:hypothetical protein